MAWVILFVAGLFEVAWAVGLKYSAGFTKLGPSVFTIVTLTVSMFLLGWAVRTLPLGTAYTVWTGIGAIGSVLLGIWLFNEPLTAVRLGCIALILIGILGLKVAAKDTAQPAVKDAAQPRNGEVSAQVK
jgi:quaternary ammonium compound-resistance protein SugE